MTWGAYLTYGFSEPSQDFLNQNLQGEELESLYFQQEPQLALFKKKKKKVINIIEHLLCVRHSSKHFACINSLSLHSNPVRCCCFYLYLPDEDIEAQR